MGVDRRKPLLKALQVMDMVRCLDWGGGRLATGCERCGAAVWSARGELVAAMGRVLALAWKDDRDLFTASRDGAIQLTRVGRDCGTW